MIRLPPLGPELWVLAWTVEAMPLFRKCPVSSLSRAMLGLLVQYVVWKSRPLCKKNIYVCFSAWSVQSSKFLLRSWAETHIYCHQVVIGTPCPWIFHGQIETYPICTFLEWFEWLAFFSDVLGPHHVSCHRLQGRWFHGDAGGFQFPSVAGKHRGQLCSVYIPGCPSGTAWYERTMHVAHPSTQKTFWAAASVARVPCLVLLLWVVQRTKVCWWSRRCGRLGRSRGILDATGVMQWFVLPSSQLLEWLEVLLILEILHLLQRNPSWPGASSQGCCRYATLWMQPTRLALLGWDRNRREVSQQHAQRCHEIHQQPFATAFPCTQAAIGSWNQTSCQIILTTSPLQSHWGNSSFQRRLGEDHCLAPSPWALCNTVWEIPQQVLGANGPRWHRSLENLLVQNEISPWVSRPPPAWCSTLRGASHTNQCPWRLCANHRHWQGVGKEPFSFALELSTLQRQFQGHMFANLYRPLDAIRMTFALPEISGSGVCYFVKIYMCNYWGLLLCCCLGSSVWNGLGGIILVMRALACIMHASFLSPH